MQFLCVSEELETCVYLTVCVRSAALMFPDQSGTVKLFRSIESIACYLRVQKQDYVEIFRVVLFLKHAGSRFSANGSEQVLML